MSNKNTNNKYIIWLYNLSFREYMIIKNFFPEEHFEVTDIEKDFTRFNELKNKKLLEKPDVVICDVNTEFTSEIKDIIYDCLCGIAKVSLRPVRVYTGNTFELTDEEISVNIKKNGRYEKKTTTKIEDAMNKIIEICQLSNIQKLQKITSKVANNVLSSIDVDALLHSGNGASYVSKEYLFKLAKILNDFISFKDHYTSGHCERVAAYSEALAIALGMDNNQVEDLILAAQLHDIGKIALPDAVITKTSKLNDLEFGLMKKHVELGTSILPANSFNSIKAAIKGHHEKIDGSGYPDGLKGDEIPYFAQILAIADSFDAMTSQRTYNKVKTAEEAFDDLLKHTKPYGVDGGLGIHYNNELVKKFIEVISNSKTIMDKLNAQKLIADMNITNDEKNEKLKKEKDYQYTKGGNFYA